MKVPPADEEVVRQVVTDLAKELLEAGFYILACIVLLGLVTGTAIAIFA